MTNIQYRIPHSDEVGLKRLELNEDGQVICPNEEEHFAHQNAIWTDWSTPQSWTCGGRP